jgi:hypothetical protein
MHVGKHAPVGLATRRCDDLDKWMIDQPFDRFESGISRSANNRDANFA